MTMATIRTAKGKEYPCDFMGVGSRHVLFIVIDIDLLELLSVFQDAEETRLLQWVGDSGSVGREEEGYTKFVGFTLLDGDGCKIRVRMERP